MTQLKRLLDEPGSDLDRVLLEAGLDEQPPKASLERTLVALGVGSATAIGASALGASGAGASLGGAKSLFGAGVAKWVGGMLLASAAIGGGFLVTRTAEAPQAAVAPAAATQAGERGERTSEARGAAPATDATTKAEAGNPELPVTQSREAAPQAKADSAPAKPTQAEAADSKASEPKPAAEKSQVAKADVAEPAAKTGKPQHEKPSPDLTAGGGSLSDELRMLDTARKALLAGDNDACLADLAKYASKFPKGQLASDAQAMRATCAAKKPASAP